jgi:hypothetical protein
MKPNMYQARCFDLRRIVNYLKVQTDPPDGTGAMAKCGMTFCTPLIRNP